MESEREIRIRQRAYELWEQEGKPGGREHAHWQAAATEIDAAEAAAADGELRVTEYNDPTRPRGAVEGSPPPGQPAMGEDRSLARRPRRKA
jgi:hypothetical protein